MPAATIYLSRLIGPTLLAAAVLMLVDKSYTSGFAAAIMEDGRALLASSLFRVVVGAAIVLVHNVWTKGLWPLVVTLCGWLLLIRGVAGLFLPGDVFNAAVGGFYVADFYYLYAAIPLILGTYLFLRGFSAPAPSFRAAAPRG